MEEQEIKLTVSEHNPFLIRIHNMKSKWKSSKSYSILVNFYEEFIFRISQDQIRLGQDGSVLKYGELHWYEWLKEGKIKPVSSYLHNKYKIAYRKQLKLRIERVKEHRRFYYKGIRFNTWRGDRIKSFALSKKLFKKTELNKFTSKKQFIIEMINRLKTADGCIYDDDDDDDGDPKSVLKSINIKTDNLKTIERFAAKHHIFQLVREFKTNVNDLSKKDDFDDKRKPATKPALKKYLEEIYKTKVPKTKDFPSCTSIKREQFLRWVVKYWIEERLEQLEQLQTTEQFADDELIEEEQEEEEKEEVNQEYDLFQDEDIFNEENTIIKS